MALAHFIYANTAKLSSIAKKKGNIILVNDSNEIYIDFSDTSRVRVGVGDPLGNLGIQTQLDNKAPLSHTHPYVTGFSVNGTTVTYTKGDGTTGSFVTQDTNTNTTYSAMTGATASAAGTIGLVPAPAAGKQAQFLRGDGTWATPTNTTYSAMTGATASAAGKIGLVPAPAAGKQAQFLRGDGTWATPTDTKYTLPDATTTAKGGVIIKTSNAISDLGWAQNAASNGYVPTIAALAFWNGAYAGTGSNIAYCKHGAIGTAAVLNKANVVKTMAISGKTITVTRGDDTTFTLTTQDTNTTYSLSSFGITSTAAELNYTDGVTSNIQTQLNGKLATSGTANKANYAGNTAYGTSSLKNIRTVPASTTLTTSNVAVGEIVFTY